MSYFPIHDWCGTGWRPLWYCCFRCQMLQGEHDYLKCSSSVSTKQLSMKHVDTSSIQWDGKHHAMTFSGQGNQVTVNVQNGEFVKVHLFTKSNNNNFTWIFGNIILNICDIFRIIIHIIIKIFHNFFVIIFLIEFCFKCLSVS